MEDGDRAFFNWFEGWNLLGDHQNLKKGWGSQKEGESNIKRGVLFSFLSIKAFVTFCYVPVSPDTTLKERSLG